MSQKQGYSSQSIFRPTPKPSYKKLSVFSHVFGQNGLPSFIIPLFLFLILVGIVWYSYPKTGDGDIVPVIQAEPTPYKHIPDNPGGMDIAHQDSSVFQPLETKELGRTEQLFITDEEPLDRMDIFENKPSRNPDFKPMINMDKPKLNLGLKLKQSGAAVEALISREETVPISMLKEKLQNPDNLEKSIGAGKTILVEKPIVKFDPEVKTSIVKTMKPIHKKVVVPVKEVIATPVEKTIDKEAIIDIGWFVQLGAFSRLEFLESAWKKKSRKYPSILGGYDYNVQKTSKNGKTIHRLRVAGFKNKAKASMFCNKIKSKGGNCIVTK